MYRLHGQDATWLYRETLTTPMHTLKIFLISLESGPRLNFDTVRSSVPRLLHEVPTLRQRPVFVPLGLHHPVMIEDPEFDLEYHLNHAALPSPGGEPELEEELAQIASYPLDQTKPLWQFWFIEGLEGGKVALVQKIHHTLADGMASVNFLMRVWNSSYHDPDTTPPTWQPEELPSRKRLLWDAIVDHIRYDVGNLPSFFRSLYRSTWAIKKFADPATSPTLMAISGDIPTMPWNRAMGSKHSFALAQLDLNALKHLKKTLGGTLNDVLLALIATSLRNYLLQHQHSVDTKLLVTIPVADSAQKSERLSGNASAITSTLLHLDIEDPKTRYSAIRASSDQGKEELEIVGRETFGLMAHYVPPVIQRRIARRAYNRQTADETGFRPPANLTVSNVPGPRSKFSAQGNLVEELYSAGPPIEGVGLNITVWSYAENMNVTMVGCKKALADIHSIAAGLAPALAELQAAANIEH